MKILEQYRKMSLKLDGIVMIFQNILLTPMTLLALTLLMLSISNIILNLPRMSLRGLLTVVCFIQPVK